MKRIAIRRVLPIVQLVLALALCAVGYFHYEEEMAKVQGTWLENSDYRFHVYNPAFEFGIAMNLPALVPLFTFYFFTEFSTVSLWVSYAAVGVGIIFLILFWYWVGLRFDRYFGLVETKPPKPGKLARFTATGILIVFCMLFLWALFFPRGPNLYPGSRIFVYSVIFWAGLISMDTGLKIRWWSKVAKNQR